MRRALYDINIALDVILQREPHFAASAEALRVAERGEVEGYLAGHAVPTLDYILRREIGPAYDRSVLQDLLSFLRIAPVTDSAVRSALSADAADFEDAVTSAVAEESGIDVIVTRDLRGFAGSAVPAETPATFCSR